MSEEEDDYMSDIFVSSSSNICPGITKVNAQKREAQQAVKKEIHLKKQRLEKEKRLGLNRNERLQEALERPIESNNKGFQLLAKMGYKPGAALGKIPTTTTSATTTIDTDSVAESSQNALVEPIKIKIKPDRGGLGRETALQELHKKRQQLKEEKIREKIGEPFDVKKARRIFIDKAEKRQVHGLLKSCQKTCENLDANAGVDTPELPWFWPERPKADEEEIPTNECEDDYTDAEKLDMLTNYLRISYRMCFYCGIQYDNNDEMEENCPGHSREDH